MKLKRNIKLKFDAEITLNDLIESFCKIAMKQIDSMYLCEEEPSFNIEDKSHRSYVGLSLSYNKVHDLDGMFDDIKLLFEDWLEKYLNDRDLDMKKLHTKPQEEGWNGEL